MNNIADWIRHQANWNPAKTALNFKGRAIGYREMDRRIGAPVGNAASRIGESNPEIGSLISVYNSPEQIELLFACARLGAILVPLNWRLVGAEQVWILNNCTPKAIFADTAFCPVVDGVADELPVGLQRITLDAGASVDWRPFTEIVTDHAAGPETGTMDESGDDRLHLRHHRPPQGQRDDAGRDVLQCAERRRGAGPDKPGSRSDHPAPVPCRRHEHPDHTCSLCRRHGDPARPFHAGTRSSGACARTSRTRPCWCLRPYRRYWRNRISPKPISRFWTISAPARPWCPRRCANRFRTAACRSRRSMD